MAKITFGKDKHLELEISPLTIWSNEGSEGEFMEYQIALTCEGKNVFGEQIAPLLIALKTEEDEYLSDFIVQALATTSENSWTPLEPKVSFYIHPLPMMGCCGALKAPFVLEINMDQNIFAGENKVFGAYSNTGLSIRFEAFAQEWDKFAQDLRQEEEDFDEETEI